jgi:8-oxo-dGTP diphosphatase
MTSRPNRFNIRVYGLLVNDAREVLLVHEKTGDVSFTKFPGGGLEFGEGTRDGLAREYKEETGIDIEVGEHFYTTDFFQQSAFRKEDQLISIYYRVKVQDASAISLDEFTLDNGGQDMQLRFFWIPVADLHKDMVTFPIDKIVAGMLHKAGH